MTLTGPRPAAAARATPPPAACDGFRSVRGLSRVTNVALDSLIDIIINALMYPATNRRGRRSPRGSGSRGTTAELEDRVVCGLNQYAAPYATQDYSAQCHHIKRFNLRI